MGLTQKVKGGYDVYLAGSAFGSKEQLYLTMGHEYMHIGYSLAGLKNYSQQHAAIYNWEYTQAKVFNFNLENERTLFYLHNYNITPSPLYDFNKLEYKLLSDPNLIWH